MTATPAWKYHGPRKVNIWYNSPSYWLFIVFTDTSANIWNNSWWGYNSEGGKLKQRIFQSGEGPLWYYFCVSHLPHPQVPVDFVGKIKIRNLYLYRRCVRFRLELVTTIICRRIIHKTGSGLRFLGVIVNCLCVGESIRFNVLIWRSLGNLQERWRIGSWGFGDKFLLIILDMSDRPERSSGRWNVDIWEDSVIDTVVD